MDDIAAMTGEQNFGGMRGTPRDELKLVGRSLNDQGGYFKLVLMTQPKVPVAGQDGKTYETYNFQNFSLEEKITLVPLIVRRRLIEKNQDGLVRWTSEHDQPSDIVQLFGEGKDKGPADMMRDRYPNLRTEQIVYCRYKGQIIRLKARGLSLRKPERGEVHTSFYQYFTSFQHPDRFWQYSMEIKPVKVHAKSGENWAIDFRRGAKLSDEQIELVKANIRDVYAENKKLDDFYNRLSPTAVAKAEGAPAISDGIEDIYPEEESNPEDIPF